jgi:hypothetical protein
VNQFALQECHTAFDYPIEELAFNFNEWPRLNRCELGLNPQLGRIVQKANERNNLSGCILKFTFQVRTAFPIASDDDKELVEFDAKRFAKLRMLVKVERLAERRNLYLLKFHRNERPATR